MEEHVGNTWYFAVNTVIFLIAMISFMLFLGLAGRYFKAETATERKQERSVVVSLDDDEGIDMYLGKNTGDDVYYSTGSAEHVSRAEVFAELLNVHESVEVITINGSIYLFGNSEDETVHGRTNLNYYLENSKTDEILSWLGTGEVFERTYEIGDDNQIKSITYKQVH